MLVLLALVLLGFTLPVFVLSGTALVARMLLFLAIFVRKLFKKKFSQIPDYEPNCSLTFSFCSNSLISLSFLSRFSLLSCRVLDLDLSRDEELFLMLSEEVEGSECITLLLSRSLCSRLFSLSALCFFRVLCSGPSISMGAMSIGLDREERREYRRLLLLLFFLSLWEEAVAAPMSSWDFEREERESEWSLLLDDVWEFVGLA